VFLRGPCREVIRRRGLELSQLIVSSVQESEERT
jgi:hypothetical protein